MELRRKLAILADAAKYDASCASSGSNRATPAGGVGNGAAMGICHSYTPDGRCVSLLKLLLTNSCRYDCRYCPSRSSSDVPRARFLPDEVVQLTLDFYRRNLIEGLFLSSGIPAGPDQTLEELVQVARTLRVEHRFGGYIHLKVPPGASQELLAQAGAVADRLSANIELPTQRDLSALAPEKSFAQVEDSMGRIAALREEQPKFAAAGQSTQMVVGATATTDAEILATSTRLYEEYDLRRVYYSGYSPVPHADPRLPPAAPPLVREHRLYQADWLLRFYGFSAAELTPPESPLLDLRIDPKLAWALRNRALFPVDVNRAPREALLRVPGLGVRSVDALVKARRLRRIRFEDLARLHVPVRRTAPFLLADGHLPRPAEIDALDLRKRVAAPKQLSLFEAAASATSGEL